jgi:hypothetical protein
MKTRLESIVKQLDNCIEEDIKISSEIFGVATSSVQKNQELLEKLKQKDSSVENKQIPPQKSPKITQEELQKRYGSYDKAYKACQESYGIKCKRGWKHLLEKIQGLEIPQTLTERVTVLEETVAILVQIFLSSNSEHR